MSESWVVVTLVGAGTIAIWRRAPLLLVVILATVTTALARALL